MGSNSKAKVATVSDLLHRVAASCLSQRFPGTTRTFDEDDDLWSCNSSTTEPEKDKDHRKREESIARAIAREKLEDDKAEEEEEEERRLMRMWEDPKDDDPSALKHRRPSADADSMNPDCINLDLQFKDQVKQMDALLAQVFDSVSAVKQAYRALQHSHCPWDPHRMQAADAAVVSELRKLDTLRDRFRRGRRRSAAVDAEETLTAAVTVREAVAPYEAAIDDLKKEIKVKEAEAENLRQKLCNSEMLGASRRARSHSSRWSKGVVGAGIVGEPQGTPIPDLFLVCMQQVKSASKSFASQLLSLMRVAQWDVLAAIQSLIPGASVGSSPNLPSHYPKYALESYVNSRLFHGFEHESFYMDGSLASLLDPAAFRRSCFTQFRDMRTMDPSEMLGVLPTCQFGRFAATKYLSLVHEKMEESLFGHKEQRQQVVAGTHPRTEFYAEFLSAAKAVWMLHLLAFALDPAPTHFEVRKGAEFQPEFMESVMRFASGRVSAGSVVGFAVSPGFKLGNGSVVRARVYLVPGNPVQ